MTHKPLVTSSNLVAATTQPTESMTRGNPLVFFRPEGFRTTPTSRYSKKRFLVLEPQAVKGLLYIACPLN